MKEIQKLFFIVIKFFILLGKPSLGQVIKKIPNFFYSNQFFLFQGLINQLKMVLCISLEKMLSRFYLFSII